MANSSAVIPAQAGIQFKKTAMRCALIALVLFSLPSMLFGAQMSDYCVVPPYAKAAAPPNLLMMIDNSASMYDLAYTDSSNYYCANDIKTSCSPLNSTCSGAASCLGSYITITSTTAAACSTDNDCNSATNGNTCSNGPISNDSCKTTGKNPSYTCNKCNVTTTTYTPISCTADSNCRHGASGSCPANTCPSGFLCTVSGSTYSCWASNGTGDTCNNKCNAQHTCYDNTYDATSTYTGYFNVKVCSTTSTQACAADADCPMSETCNTPVYYSYDLTNNKFTSSLSGITGSCTYSAGLPAYLCVNTSGAPETLNGFKASGNFLNWVSASKFDIQKQILTGGKFDTTNSVLLAESRGCGGRDFLKFVPIAGGTCSGGADYGVTFAVRGGTPGGVGSTQSLATEYGQTYIAVYTGCYNTTDCLNAMYDWMNVTSVNLGSFQNDTKGCVGSGSGPLNATDIWNHSLHDCYQGMTGGAGGYSTNLNALEIDCKSIYQTVAPNQITDPNSAYSVCSSVLTYSLGGTNYTGYLGTCWNGSNFNGPCNPNVATQMQNYCLYNVQSANPVVDPSSTTLTNNTASAPGFIMEQGLNNMTPVGTMTAKVGLTSAPTGLISQFQNLIRFGVMTFNNNGSLSECGSGNIPCSKYCSNAPTRVCYFDSDCPTGGTCPAYNAANNKDGGYIPTGAYVGDPVGDHSSGIIQAIDNIQATSWTPFAEAFYEAIGYLAKVDGEAYQIPPTAGTSRDFRGSQTGDYVLTKNPSLYQCQDNDILLITDGMSTADQGPTSNSADSLASVYVTGATDFPSPKVSGYDSGNSCPNYKGSRSLYDLAWLAQNRNIRKFSTSTASTDTPSVSSEKINTYVVYTGKAAVGSQPGLCDPYTLMYYTAKYGQENGNGSLLTASSPSEVKRRIRDALNSVIKRAASGTAASVLASGEGSGANLIQAVFYPKRRYQDQSGVGQEVAWTGRVSNLWYYSDPFFSTSKIYDDYSGSGTNDYTLNVGGTSDRSLNTYYVPKVGETYTKPNGSSATVPSPNGVAYTNRDGSTGHCSECTLAELSGGTTTTMKLEDLYVLWESGSSLWSRAGSDRTIYAPCLSGATCVSGTNLMNFDQTNKTKLLANMNTSDAKIIDYVRGYDKFCTVTGAGCEKDTDCAPNTCAASSYRSRSFSIDLNNDGAITSNEIKVWKLGDVLDSTPKISSWVALNNYDIVYNDTTYSTYTGSSTYTGRGMVFAGGNDGMLHAFNLGLLQMPGSSWTPASSNEKAHLAGTSTNLGKETWAFIPQNALPYLWYMADPNYCHVFTVDLTPYIFDASINGLSTDTRTSSSWQTVLIGGMRYGGACRDSGGACNSNSCSATSGTSCTTAADCPSGEACLPNCVKTPLSGVGYSSYFALDVTDQNYPKFLWEFSDADIAAAADKGLGFASSGPSVVRINSRDASNKVDESTNGNWFVVFGSGSTGPIDSSSQQFLGRSDQNLKFYILNLRKTPSSSWTKGTNYWVVDTAVPSAFAGNMLSATVDPDLNYGDNALYIPYVKKANDGTWTQGGIGRLQTLEDTNPGNWQWSKVVDNTGPVTTAVARLQNTKTNALWLFAGTGRYYYKMPGTADDATGQRELLGFQEPCFSDIKNNNACTASLSYSGDFTTNSSGSNSTLTTPGWKIDLEGSGTGPCGGQSCYAERVITDPSATTSGMVFFTSYKPYSSVCALGGKSFMWAVRYDTGGAISGSALVGKILLQLSTGSIEQVDISTAFADQSAAGMYGRRSAVMEGQPPTSKPPLLSTQNPVKRVLHMKER